MTGRKSLIDINFAGVNHRFISRLRIALIIIAAALFVGAVVLVLQARSLRAQANAMEQGLSELAASMEKMKPAIEERQLLVKNLSAMSALLEARKFSWVRMLSGMEDSFPSGVALNALSANPSGASVTLEGIAQSPEALSKLMIGLQKSRSFRSPQLKRQSLDKGSIEFHVSVTYQDVTEAADIHGAVR